MEVRVDCGGLRENIPNTCKLVKITFRLSWPFFRGCSEDVSPLEIPYIPPCSLTPSQNLEIQGFRCRWITNNLYIKPSKNKTCFSSRFWTNRRMRAFSCLLETAQNYRIKCHILPYRLQPLPSFRYASHTPLP